MMSERSQMWQWYFMEWITNMIHTYARARCSHENKKVSYAMKDKTAHTHKQSNIFYADILRLGIKMRLLTRHETFFSHTPYIFNMYAKASQDHKLLLKFFAIDACIFFYHLPVSHIFEFNYLFFDNILLFSSKFHTFQLSSTLHTCKWNMWRSL